MTTVRIAPIRITMWSGPRNISTAMMRSFENRPDCAVVDEPFYAAYLAQTGLDHPLRDEVLASQPTDWRVVARGLAEDEPAPVFYQKHMTHHMLPGIGLAWMDACRNAFLIRDRPAAVLASYVKARAEVTLADIGVVRQHELFDREADRLGHAPPGGGRAPTSWPIPRPRSSGSARRWRSRSSRRDAGLALRPARTATESGPRPGTRRWSAPPASPRRSARKPRP